MANYLDIKFYSSDLDTTVTLREYLKRLLYTLWDEADGFSGKRPFGNSGWQTSIAESLVKAGALEGTIDDDDYLHDYDETEFDLIITTAIGEL